MRLRVKAFMPWLLGSFVFGAAFKGLQNYTVFANLSKAVEPIGRLMGC